MVAREHRQICRKNLEVKSIEFLIDWVIRSQKFEISNSSSYRKAKMDTVFNLIVLIH